MTPPREPHDIDRTLSQLPVSRAPEGLWEKVRNEVDNPSASPRMLLDGRPVASRLLTAAAILVALFGGGTVGVLRSYRAPTIWEVAPISGAPRTSMSRIARAASSTVSRRTTTNACGNRVWSMISTARPSAAGQMLRVGRPPTFMIRSLQHPPGDGVELGDQRFVADLGRGDQRGVEGGC